MPDGARDDATGIDVKSFEAVDASKEPRAYVDTLDVFDGLPGIQVSYIAVVGRLQG